MILARKDHAQKDGAAMNRITYYLLAGLVLTGMLSSLALGQSSATPSQNTAAAGQGSDTAAQNNQEQSLGSYARAVRKNKQPGVKQFDNDNLPKSDKISVVGDSTPSASTPADSQDDAQAQAGQANQDKPKVMPGQTQEQRQQVYDQWQGKITDQQNQIDAMAHELDLDQREYRLRAAAFYADAGNRLRNEADWDKQDADYKQKIADKQKALDDAKQKLSDLQEDARKAGVPESARQAGASDSSPE